MQELDVFKCCDKAQELKMQLSIDFDVNQLKPNQCYLKDIVLTLQSCWQEKNTFYSNLMLKVDGKCIYRRFNFDKNRFWFEESSTLEKRAITSKFEELIKESLETVKQHIVFCDAKL